MSIADLSDFREIGREFGRNIAVAVSQAIDQGFRDPALHRDYVFGVLLPAKADELRIMGASQLQTAAYVRCARREVIKLMSRAA